MHQLHIPLLFSHPLRSTFAAAAMAIALAGCGGGEDITATPRAEALRAPIVPDAISLMNWGEVSQYAPLFPGHPIDRFFGPYIYRVYANGNYLGVAGQDIFIWGPVSGNAPDPVRVGALADFACQVNPGSCLGVSSLRGQTLYGTLACGPCHGTPPATNNVLRAAGLQGSSGEADQISQAIASNAGGMARFSAVSAADLADIAAYINAVRWSKPLQ